MVTQSVTVSERNRSTVMSNTSSPWLVVLLVWLSKFQKTYIRECVYNLIWSFYSTWIGLHDITASCQEWCRCPAGALASVRSGAEIGLLSFRLSISQDAPLGDFLLAPSCPIEKVTLWAGLLYLTSRSGDPGCYPLGYHFYMDKLIS